jgi:hypothetical protein
MAIVTTSEVHDRVKHVEALQDEIEILKSRIEDHGTGHIHTAISVLESRIKELSAWIVQNY